MRTFDKNVNACNTVYKRAVEDDTNDVTLLNTSKSDGSVDLKSDNFIHGTNKL